jgi:hypothetical protein
MTMLVLRRPASFLLVLLAVGTQTACSQRAEPIDSRALPGAGLRPLIFDGGPSPAAHDYVLVMANLVESNGLECNAVLIAPNLVMTARHCVANLTSTARCTAKGTQPTHFKTDFPAEHLTFARDAYLQEKLAGIHGTQIIAPEGHTLCSADIALVVLNKPVTGITPAVVAQTPAAVGDLLTVIGTGEVDTQGDFANTRQERSDVAVTHLGPIELVQGATDLAVGAGELTTTAAFCHGDSGGAAISSKGEVVGLVSRTASCADGPDVFTTVAGHADLIANAMSIAVPPAPGDAGAADAGEPDPTPTSTSSSGCTVSRRASGGDILAPLFAVLSLLLASRLARRQKSRGSKRAFGTFTHTCDDVDGAPKPD